MLRYKCPSLVNTLPAGWVSMFFVLIHGSDRVGSGRVKGCSRPRQSERVGSGSFPISHGSSRVTLPRSDPRTVIPPVARPAFGEASSDMRRGRPDSLLSTPRIKNGQHGKLTVAL